MEITVYVRSLRSSNLSPTIFLLDKTSWGVGNAAVSPLRRKANMVAQADGEFGPGLTPDSSKLKKKYSTKKISAALAMVGY